MSRNNIEIRIMKGIKKIAIVVAMDSELELIQKSTFEIKDVIQEQTFEFFVGSFKDYPEFEIILSKSGIGKVNSAICASKIIEKFSPDLFISSGVCGCLNKTTGIIQGDIVVPLSVCYHDAYCGDKKGQIQGMPELFKTAEFSEEFIVWCRTTLPIRNVYGCRMISGDWFVDSIDVAEKIYADFCKEDERVFGIDMESGSIAQTCHIYSVPFFGIRIVSDTPLMEGQPKYEDFWLRAPGDLNCSLMGVLEFLKTKC